MSAEAELQGSSNGQGARIDAGYDQLRHDLDVVARRFVSLLRDVQAPTGNAVGAWAAADVAAHVCAVTALNTAFATGHAAAGLDPVLDLARTVTATSHPDLTARANAWVGTRDPAELAERVENGIADLLAKTVQTDGNEPRTWLGGVQLSIRALLGHMVSELLVHGHDIARAAHRPWALDAPARHFFESFAGEMLPAAMDAGFFDVEQPDLGPVDWEIRLRGSIASGFSFRDGALAMVPAARGRFDVHISATPAAMLLVLYHRVNPVVPVLRGQMLVWGRRPWRVLRVMRALPAL